MSDKHETVAVAEALRGVLGDQGVISDPTLVAPYTRDKWPRLLLAPPSTPPAIVALPKTREEVQAIVRFARERKLPVVTRGGGSGVCGALEASSPPLRIVLSTERLDAVRRIDVANRFVEVESGKFGPSLEEALNAEALTLGHFPASLAISTVGGWIATRSSGQASGRYGKIEQMIRGLEVVLGTGELVTLDDRAGTVGPDLIPLIAGSEGSLGIITAATLAAKPLPTERRFLHLEFPDWPTAVAAVRTVAQCGLEPAIVRLYDGFDARYTLLSDHESSAPLGWLKRNLLERNRFVTAISRVMERSFRPRMIIVCEGAMNDADRTADEQRRLAAIGIKAGGKLADGNAAKTWYGRRYALSFDKVEGLVRQGCFIDTVDLMVPWTRMEEAHRDIVRMLSPYALGFAHVSHLTPHGGCLYLTFVGKKKEGQVDAYDEAWRGILRYCLDRGIGISDHHGIGTLKKKPFEEHRGGIWFDLVRSLKERCDPDGILAP